jgi:UDP-N-acetylglucosamine 3-dehydrogenase
LLRCKSARKIKYKMGYGNVAVDEPLCLSIREALEIRDAVTEAGVRLIPSFMMRYYDECMETARLIRAREIGEIVQIRLRNNTRNNPQTVASYGGCMMDIGCHGFDLVRSFMGDNVNALFAVPPGSSEVEVNAVRYGIEANLCGIEQRVSWAYATVGGVHVLHDIHWSQISLTNSFEAEIYGTKGVIYVRKGSDSAGLMIGSNNTGNPRKEISWREVRPEPAFNGELHHRLFIDDLLDNTSNSLSVADAIASLKMVEAARRSMVTGRMEKLLEL